MELTDLRYFLHVVDAGGFGRGAKRAHVTPPAMSKAIARLEEDVGVRLLRRTTRRMQVTEAGRALASHARRILADVEQARRDIDTLAGRVEGELRVAAMEVFSMDVLPVALTRLIARYPKLIPKCQETIPERMEPLLAEGRLDVGFSIGGGPGRGVTRTPLGSSPGYLVCGRAHPLYGAARVSRADLSRFPFVVPRFAGSEALPPLDQYPEDRRPRVVGATIELLMMGVAMTVGGAWLGYFPEISIRRQLADGSLHRLRGAPRASFELSAFTASDSEPRVAVRELIGEVRTALSERIG